MFQNYRIGRGDWCPLMASHGCILASRFLGSKKKLGLQCGLKRTYVGALERTEVNPGIDNLDKLAVGVGVFAYVLLLSPDVAYGHIFAAFSLKLK